MIIRSRRSPSRLRRRNEVRVITYSIAAAASAVAIVVMVILQTSIDLIVGAAGILLSLLIFLIQEGGFLKPRLKKVVFLGKSNSAFSSNILNGLKDTLTPAIPVDLKTMLPNAKHEKDDLAFQVDCLRQSAIQGADALVIVPAGDSEPLCQELTRLTRKGLFVVVIDYKMPNRYFYEDHLRLPRFVTSDFHSGGRLVAGLVAETMQVAKSEIAIVLMGPTSSAPGLIRSQSCVFELAKRRLLAKVVSQELENWDEDEAVERFLTSLQFVRRSALEPVSKICVFCANDANCRAIDEFLSKRPDLTDDQEFVLIGYDGVRNSDEQLAMAFTRLCVGTVDVLPRSQGRSAGAFLVEEYEGRTSEAAKNAVIVPKLLRRSSWR